MLDLVETCRALVANAQRILCDIDGCLVRGDTPIEGAVAFAQSVAEKLVLVSNNSTDTSNGLSLRLSQMGFTVPAERLFLAGEQTLLHLYATHRTSRIMLIATEAINNRALQLGFDLTSEQPDLIVLCRAPQASFVDLETALRHIVRGVPAVAANPDLTHPGPNGPAIETGAVAGLLRACHPDLSLPFIGKPEASLFHLALEGVEASLAVMIGDNPDTDIAGAKHLGMPSILVHSEQRLGRTVADLVMPASKVVHDERSAHN